MGGEEGLGLRNTLRLSGWSEEVTHIGEAKEIPRNVRGKGREMVPEGRRASQKVHGIRRCCEVKENEKQAVCIGFSSIMSSGPLQPLLH